MLFLEKCLMDNRVYCAFLSVAVNFCGGKVQIYLTVEMHLLVIYG